MKYTIHRALALLKTTSKRIENKLLNTKFIYVTIGKATTIKGHAISDLEVQIKADYDSIVDLISNYQKLKGAIVRFNAGITPEIEKDLKLIEVKSLQQRLTVAEVIEAQRMLSLREQFLDELQRQLVAAETDVQCNQARIENDQAINNYILAVSGQDKKQLSETEIEKHLNQYHAAKDAHLVDPLNLRELTKKLEKNLEDARVELDAILSEQNALNTIEVDLTE